MLIKGDWQKVKLLAKQGFSPEALALFQGELPWPFDSFAPPSASHPGKETFGPTAPRLAALYAFGFSGLRSGHSLFRAKDKKLVGGLCCPVKHWAGWEMLRITFEVGIEVGEGQPGYGLSFVS